MSIQLLHFRVLVFRLVFFLVFDIFKSIMATLCGAVKKLDANVMATMCVADKRFDANNVEVHCRILVNVSPLD